MATAALDCAEDCGVWKKSKFPDYRAWLFACARCKQRGRKDPRDAPTPPTPTDHHYAADVDSDGDVDVVATFDVGEHTVAEVLDWVQRNPDSCDEVREAEEAGKGRVSLLDNLPC